MMASALPAGAGDFDFLLGNWYIMNERLTSRLTGSADWEHFDASGAVEPILGGLGNVDRFRSTRHGTEFHGVSLRLFSVESRLWSIYWADSQRGELLPPVVGSLTDTVGEFHGDDEHEGRPVRVRFRWSDITATSAR